MKRLPLIDGVDHINVYSKGKTKLGRWLSNFTFAPITLSDDGYFDSIEGYWYWLACRDDRLRTQYGPSAKTLGQMLRPKDWVLDEVFQDKIRAALDVKLQSNEEMKGLFIESALPFAHYYVYNAKRIQGGHAWVIEHLEKRRAEWGTSR